jgi:glutamate-1-semialdehyde aminotransferase
MSDTSKGPKKGPALYAHAKKRIPGGTSLLSKRPEMFLPEHWPSYYASAKGVEIVDLDGDRYIDMTIMGMGACVLGYADDEVDDAVRRTIANGVASSLNAPEEVELADLLCELHPWADKVRYARGGGEILSIAIRIARAHTRRDKIAFSGYHGWTDWYLSANLGESDALDGHLLPGLDPAGVPRALRETALPFRYNRLDELEAIVEKNRGQIAAIVMEPGRDEPPQPGYLEAVRRIATDIGAVLVFDEVTSGFRMTPGGIHLTMGVQPDLATFAKGLGNGYAISALVGRGAVMEAAQSTFISSTNWTERIGPTAAVATIKKFRRERAHEHMIRVGTAVVAAWQRAADAAGLKIHTGKIPVINHFRIEHPEERAMQTLFTQLMLARGFLASANFRPSLAHRPEHLERYAVAVMEVFQHLADSARRGDLQSQLAGPVQMRGFARLTS